MVELDESQNDWKKLRGSELGEGRVKREDEGRGSEERGEAKGEARMSR